MSTPTPRTDAENFGESCATEFCRQLERPLAAATKERDALRTENESLKLACSFADAQSVLFCNERDQLRADLAQAKADTQRIDQIIAISATWTSRETIDDRLRRIKEGTL